MTTEVFRFPYPRNATERAKIDEWLLAHNLNPGEVNWPHAFAVRESTTEWTLYYDRLCWEMEADEPNAAPTETRLTMKIASPPQVVSHNGLDRQDSAMLDAAFELGITVENRPRFFQRMRDLAAETDLTPGEVARSIAMLSDTFTEAP